MNGYEIDTNRHVTEMKQRFWRFPAFAVMMIARKD